MKLFFDEIKPFVGDTKCCQIFLDENYTTYFGTIYFEERVTFSWSTSVEFLTESQMQQILSFIRQNKE